MKFRVFYMRPDFFDRGIRGANPDVKNLAATHSYLRTVDADNLDQLFRHMQAGVPGGWSPNGECNSLIHARGLAHSSMSVGDIVQFVPGRYWIVRDFGWAVLNPCREPFAENISRDGRPSPMAIKIVREDGTFYWR
jgi:hypothetical protein